VEPIIPSLHGFRSDPIGFAGGEYLPLPASKGLAFPFLLTSMGTPLHTYNLRSEIMGSTQKSGSSTGIAGVSPFFAHPEGCGFIHSP